MTTLYTVSRITKQDKFIGPQHGSSNGEITLCGKNLDENWFILNNTFEGKITCSACKKIAKIDPLGILRKEA